MEDESKNNVEEPQFSYPFSKDIKLREGKKLRVLSLFSGCGGMDLGFEGGFIAHKGSINEKMCPDFISEHLDNDFVRLTPTVFQTVFANDILPDARAAWVHYFSKSNDNDGVYRTESVVDLVKMHRDSNDIFPKNIDVVTGGFPCQDFSVAGKRRGFESHKDHNGNYITSEIATEETRGKLYFWMKEVIDITRPKIFVAENVKGLTNLGNVKDIIQKDFSSAAGNDYIVLPPQVLHAADYGVPQSRERVIFIGIRKDLLKPTALKNLEKESIPEKYNPYPKPTHNYHIKDKRLAQFQTVRNVFESLDEPSDSNDDSQKYYSQAKYMGAHCQGQNEVNLDDIGPTIRSEHHGNIEYRRLSAEHGGKYTDELKAGKSERRLTPRECAMIQTFPPDYDFVFSNSYNGKKFAVSPSGAYKIIGNAVPPVLAYNIARRLQQVWPLYFD